MRTMMAPKMKTALFVIVHWVFQYAMCRDVTLPNGPLFRVAGFRLALPCQVSGYEGSRTQEFEWFLYRNDAGGKQIGVVSTRDKGFPYAPFQARVRNGEVRIERDSGDMVRLVIQRLRAEDEGKYECYTPSTDSTYQGNYSALVPVKVIPDSLQISYIRSLTSQPVPEGSELTLMCSSSIQSEQLTHLSIVFGKRGGSERSDSGAGSEVSTIREIISIDKLLGVVPGRFYKKRYDDGEITLEKRNGEGGQGLYLMKMKAVQPDDAGSYFCEASQWIRDPDRTWQRIAQRTLDIGNLTIQQLAESLGVVSSPRGEVTLQVGSPLILTCEVLGLASEVNSGLLVQWMKRGSVSSDAVGAGGVEVEVARMSPDGTVSWGDDLSRASGGSLEKVSEGTYSLKLFSARPADSGVYRCVVSVYAGRKNPSLSIPATLTQRSEGVTVNLKTKDVLVSAVARLPRGPLLKRGSTITIICNATATATGPVQVQVQWLRRPIPEPVITRNSGGAPLDAELVAQPTLIATLMYNGVANIYVNDSEISIDRLSAVSYRLRIHMSTVENQGMYGCRAEVWGQDPHGGWYDTGAKAESNEVTVYLYARESTTSASVTVSTSKQKEVVTTTWQSGSWITTVTIPLVTADTDQPHLGENYPSHTEMALVYQSAAWILAGLLLAIIIFLIVALLINKKKKWVQMSCYSAPKKTVILKKHVNKNSVIYMETSKENKFQNMKSDCGIIHFSPEISSPPCTEKMTIPRAKLSMGSDWTPR